MATSPEAFEQVKGILRKLDQSIDAARHRRLAGQAGPAVPPSGMPELTEIGGANGSTGRLNGGAGQASGPANPGVGTPARPLNRARPMLRPDGDSFGQ